MKNVKRRLNPFGSGMFFIHLTEDGYDWDKGLNPFGSGMFFIPTSLNMPPRPNKS